MEFNNTKPIFLQIHDTLIEQLLIGELFPRSRVLSVRDMAEKISVNPNTVQRAYTELQNSGIIEQQRGIGYFITANANELALQIRRDEFMRYFLPQLINQMKILNLSWDDLKSMRKPQ